MVLKRRVVLRNDWGVNREDDPRKIRLVHDVAQIFAPCLLWVKLGPIKLLTIQAIVQEYHLQRVSIALEERKQD